MDVATDPDVLLLNVLAVECPRCRVFLAISQPWAG
jgi:hypothetical protein